MNITTKSLALFLATSTFGATAATPDRPPATNSAAPPKAAINPSDLFSNDIVAKGKGVEIKRNQLDEALISLKSSAAARGQNIPPEQMVLFERQVLERLIQIQLLLTKASNEDQAKGKETSAKRFENIKTRAGTEEALNRQLKSVGMSQEELRKNMTDEATAEAVLERELHVNVTDDEVKKFYDDNPARFEQPESVRASHILLGTRDQKTGAELTADQKAAKHKEMEGILKRARDGEDFGKLAKEYSEDPGSKDKGGEYTFPRGQMVPEFETAAFSMNTNQISDIITTQFGYHIIKLLEKLPAKKVEFAKVSSDIKDYLKQESTQKQLPEYVEKLKKEANVEILDDKLKAAQLPTPTGVPAGHPAIKAEPK